MKRLIYKYSPPIIRNWLKQFFIKQYRKSISHKSVYEVFKDIYDKKLWGNRKNLSGTGSTIDQTKEIIIEIPKLLRRYNIASILDLPCGDFSWTKHMNINKVNYLGGDIVKEIIDDNNSKFSTNYIRFQQINIIEDRLPKVDLLLCRDCFVHLSNQQIKLSLQNIRKYDIKYLLVTSFTNKISNQDIITGEWRAVNMEIEPFNLKRIDIIDEKCPEGNGKHSDKSLILIKLNN